MKIDACERNLKASQVTTGKESPLKVVPPVQAKVSSSKVAPL
jgi:hypothetical protein